MPQLRSMGLALLAAFVGVVACGPEVKEPEQSNRHLAAEYCDWNFDKHEQCGKTDTPDERREWQGTCEGDAR